MATRLLVLWGLCLGACAWGACALPKEFDTLNYRYRVEKLASSSSVRIALPDWRKLNCDSHQTGAATYWEFDLAPVEGIQLSVYLGNDFVQGSSLTGIVKLKSSPRGTSIDLTGAKWDNPWLDHRLQLLELTSDSVLFRAPAAIAEDAGVQRRFPLTSAP
ncbi:hypothetical protein K2X33_04195 [bacterium]|nr:hypothetical protein [bacterium]